FGPNGSNALTQITWKDPNDRSKKDKTKLQKGNIKDFSSLLAHIV
ncbi:unnamed protein product, partial [Allacma fusca]